MEECLVRIDFSLRWILRYAQHDRKGAQRDRMARTQILRYAGSLAGARDDVGIVILSPLIVILSAAKDLAKRRVQILRYAQNDS